MHQVGFIRQGDLYACWGCLGALSILLQGRISLTVLQGCARHTHVHDTFVGGHGRVEVVLFGSVEVGVVNGLGSDVSVIVGAGVAVVVGEEGGDQ